MSFYPPFPPSGGPNDPPPLQLTPQQYTFAAQQYHYAAQMQQNPGSLRLGPLTPFAPPVIDPTLLPAPQMTTEARLAALERELEDLKTQKRAQENDGQQSSTKRRKRNNQPSPYILRHKNGLTKGQIEVRKELMRKMKKELINLTGTNSRDDSSTSSDSDNSSNVSPPSMSFDFAAKVDDDSNLKIIARAAELIWTEQHDPKSSTFSLAHKDVSFTRSDLVDFGKTNFRSWKKKWNQTQNNQVAARAARQASKDRQGMRRKELKQNRLAAVKEFRKLHKKNPSCVLESEWMSDEISAPDTDDEDKRKTHRQLLVRKARLGPDQQAEPVWEVVRPAFQSKECVETKDELDRILKKAKQAAKRKSRTSVPRVRLGATHDRIPTGTLWPFMISTEWYDATSITNPDLDNAFAVYTENPDGFGDEGYDGGDEAHDA
ncbi:hypothetical protein C8R47DRAFT_1328857 [Mycena vitilis]|nr:hypothetical protein C8R47DRAFT_1328857 [Mycena vitilis]